MPGGAHHRSQSVPFFFVPVMWYGVQGGSSLDVCSALLFELSELRDLLKSQQSQLDQLSKSVARLQMVAKCSQAPQTRHSPYSQNPSSYGNPIICRRYQQPGHFAREHDGERVPTHPPSSALQLLETSTHRAAEPQLDWGTWRLKYSSGFSFGSIFDVIHQVL